jgi:hypothetical protein
MSKSDLSGRYKLVTPHRSEHVASRVELVLRMTYLSLMAAPRWCNLNLEATKLGNI